MLSLLALSASASLNSLVINEISDKGTPPFCDGDDWVEIAYSGAAGGPALDLSGYKLCDSDGCGDDDAYVFGAGASIEPNAYLAVCHVEADVSNQTQRRWIGSNDTITLFDANGTALDSTTLGNNGDEHKTWARNPDGTGAFEYTWNPTPGALNTGAATPCERLASAEGHNCSACVEALPAASQSCASSAAEEWAAEEAALFGSDGPSQLWTDTKFLYEAESVWQLKVEMSDADWQFLVDNPGREEYVTSTVKLEGADGATVGEWGGVGIRFKGYFGSLRICLIGWFSCNKLSYKLKFDWTNTSQRFYGQKRLQLHAGVGDATLMRERLSYSMFRAMGVPAVRQTYSVLHVNGQRMGVHLITEVIDGRFTKAYYDEGQPGSGDGNLYKEAWPGYSLESSTQATAEYAYTLRTNEDTADLSKMLAFGAALRAATDDYELGVVVKEYTPSRYWAAYLVIDRILEHWDGPSNFRYFEPSATNTGGSSTHNFFMYEDDRSAAQREFRIVPWDLDNVFGSPDDAEGLIGERGGSPAGPWDTPICGDGVASGTGGCITCEPFASTNGMSETMHPGCFRLLRAFMRPLRDVYMAAAADALAGPAQPCQIKAKIDRWRAMAEAEMRTDAEAGLYPTTSNNPYTWGQHVGYLRETAVDHWIDTFRGEVSCARDYPYSAWSDTLPTPPTIVPWETELFETGAWDGAPMGGGGDGDGGGGASAVLIVIVVVFVLVALVGAAVAVACKMRAAKKAQNNVLSTSSAATVPLSAVAQEMLVTVPPGAAAGSQVQITSPAGNMMTVVVPANLVPGQQFKVNVPASG